MSTDEWLWMAFVMLCALMSYFTLRPDDHPWSRRCRMGNAAAAGGGSALFVTFGFGVIDGRSSLGATMAIAVVLAVSVGLVYREGRRILTDFAVWVSGMVLVVCGLVLL